MTAFCALCTRDIIGPACREPLGRNDALVNVCSRCATERPIERDDLFSARGGIGRDGVGEGNRNPGGRSGVRR